MSTINTTLQILENFVTNDCLNAEPIFEKQLQEATDRGRRWSIPPIMFELQQKAKKLGLWNLFLPKEHEGDGKLTNLEYASFCIIMGRSFLAPEACNCAAPDTGNMEVLLKYGSAEQKERWLQPLLEGTIRSAFLMTEPEVASSDPTNLQTKIEKNAKRGTYIINGRKWWSTGALDPRCKVALVVGLMSGPEFENAPIHKKHSIIIIPMDHPGVRIIRPLHVFGYDDAPHGHAEIELKDIEVPLSNIVLGEGRGFQIAQGRLGPGRLHHCMRAVGMMERALAGMIQRAQQRVVFSRPIIEFDSVELDIAQSYVDIASAKALVIDAARAVDQRGGKGARMELAVMKATVPSLALQVFDRAIQVHGGAGVCQDTLLPRAYAQLRTLRIADGPDQVHLRTVGRLAIKRYQNFNPQHIKSKL